MNASWAFTQSAYPCTNPNPNPNPNPVSFANPGDFNGDCRSDILWRNVSTGQVYEWFISGTAMTGSGSPGTPTSDWVIQDVGDFNGDGYADILWRNSNTGHGPPPVLTSYVPRRGRGGGPYQLVSTPEAARSAKLPDCR